jgi:hypothetical protein
MPLPECAALDQYRLEKDWTFDELAAAMSRAKLGIPARTLNYLLRSPGSIRPLDRTLFKIRKYLKRAQAADARRATERRRRRTAAADAEVRP